jgi:hypothetical protein
MKRITWKLKILLPILSVAVLLFSGCEGSEPRNQVDDTVREVTGAKHVERYQDMKKDLKVIEEQKANHARQLEESAE